MKTRGLKKELKPKKNEPTTVIKNEPTTVIKNEKGEIKKVSFLGVLMNLDKLIS